jgi:hypothetical protein
MLQPVEDVCRLVYASSKYECDVGDAKVLRKCKVEKCGLCMKWCGGCAFTIRFARAINQNSRFRRACADFIAYIPIKGEVCLKYFTEYSQAKPTRAQVFILPLLF